VTSVEPGSAAAEAGIAPGMIIRTIDGKQIKGLTEYRTVTKSISGEKDVRLLVTREEQNIFIILKSGK